MTRRSSSSRRGAATGPDGPRPAHVVVGVHPVVAALDGGVPAEALIVAAGGRLPEAVERAAAGRRVPVREVARSTLDSWSDGASHQGVALAVPAFSYVGLDQLVRRASDPSLYVALDGITDPRNLGAVARSALAFGADGLVIPDRRSAGVSPAAWKTSAGALSALPVARVGNLRRALSDLQGRGVFVVGLSGDSADSLYDARFLDAPVCVVIGSEGRGLGRLVSQTCDITVSIPVDERVESLNASVAAAVALAEIARFRRLA